MGQEMDIFLYQEQPGAGGVVMAGMLLTIPHSYSSYNILYLTVAEGCQWFASTFMKAIGRHHFSNTVQDVSSDAE